MKVKELLKQMNKKLEDYADFDVDDDWDREIKDKMLYDAIKDSLEDTDLTIEYYWDNDD